MKGYKKILQNIKPYDQKTFGAMIPGPFQQFLRTCVIWQLIRFAIINLKMIRVIAKSHH